MTNRTKALITIILFAVIIVATAVVFDFGLIVFFEDSLTNLLFCGTMSRAIIALIFIYVVATYYSDRAFRITNGGLRGLAWAFPCFLVAIANFPFSALIQGNATITRMDVMYLYVFYTLATAIYEELVFRGFLVLAVKSFLYKNPNKNLFTVLIASAIFALLHSLNFGIALSIDVIVQIGYSFLIGCMLSTLYLYTKNIYLCIGIHAIFNFGGLLINTIGSGYAWDWVFWVLTAVCGVFCAVHVVFTILKMDRSERYVS